MAKGNTDSFYHNGDDSKVVDHFKKKAVKEKRSLSFYVVEGLKNLLKKEKRRAK